MSYSLNCTQSRSNLFAKLELGPPVSDVIRINCAIFAGCHCGFASGVAVITSALNTGDRGSSPRRSPRHSTL